MENGSILKKRDEAGFIFPFLAFSCYHFSGTSSDSHQCQILISQVHSCDPEVLLYKFFGETKGKVDHKIKAEFLFLVQFQHSAAISNLGLKWYRQSPTKAISAFHFGLNFNFQFLQVTSRRDTSSATNLSLKLPPRTLNSNSKVEVHFLTFLAQASYLDLISSNSFSFTNEKLCNSIYKTQAEKFQNQPRLQRNFKYMGLPNVILKLLW